MLSSILIGAAIAALAAIPRVLDVLEAIQAAANDPSALPLMRMLEQDLAFHFITNLVIYSVIAGAIILGWRRNRNLALSILGAAVTVIVLLAVFGSGVLDQSSAPSATQISSSQPFSKPSGISAGGSEIFITPTAKPSGISAGGSDFFNDDSESAAPAEVLEKDRQDFLAFDLLVSDWMGEMLSILDRQARGVIDPPTAADELDELHSYMGISHEVRATGKLPLLIQIFKALVVKLSDAMYPPFQQFQNPPDQGVSASRLADALEYFDYAIEKYADYGSSLGFDTWSTVCAGDLEHPRCD